MKFHGNTSPSWQRVCGFLLVCACFLPALCGCRSSHKAVRFSTTVSAEAFTNSAFTDSVATGQSDSVYQRSVSREDSRDTGSIRINRDSAGRPILIFWSRELYNTNLEAFVKGSETLFSLRGFEGRSSKSGTTDSVAQEEEEAQEVVDAGGSLKEVVLKVVLLGVLLFLIYVFFSFVIKPWLLQRHL